MKNSFYNLRVLVYKLTPTKFFKLVNFVLVMRPLTDQGCVFCRDSFKKLT